MKKTCAGVPANVTNVTWGKDSCDGQKCSANCDAGFAGKATALCNQDTGEWLKPAGECTPGKDATAAVHLYQLLSISTAAKAPPAMHPYHVGHENLSTELGLMTRYLSKAQRDICFLLCSDMLSSS